MKKLILLILLTGCSSPQQSACVPQQTRCNRSTIEICTPGRSWAPITECSTITPGDWLCGDIDGSATCFQEQDDATSP